MHMKYLFTATFADGSTIEQTPDDKSTIEPEKRSQFYDVLKLAETKELVRFELRLREHAIAGPTGVPTERYAVDLRDGHFEVNGVPFRMHEDSVVGFELIYFRQHTHSFNQTQHTTREVSHDIVFRIGWKLKGNQNYQRVMQID